MVAIRERFHRPKILDVGTKVRATLDTRFPKRVERRNASEALVAVCRERAERLLHSFEVAGEIAPELASEMLHARNSATYDTLNYLRESNGVGRWQQATESKPDDSVAKKVGKFFIKPKTVRAEATSGISLAVGAISMIPVAGRIAGAVAGAAAVLADRSAMGLGARAFMDQRVGAREVRNYLKARYGKKRNKFSELADLMEEDRSEDIPVSLARELLGHNQTTNSRPINLQYIINRLENTLTFDTGDMKIGKEKVDLLTELSRQYLFQEALAKRVFAQQTSEEERRESLAVHLRTQNRDPRKMISFIGDTAERIKRRRRADMAWASAATAGSTAILGGAASYGGAFLAGHLPEVGLFKDRFFGDVNPQGAGNVAGYLEKKELGEATVLDYHFLKHGVTPETFAERAKDVHRAMFVEEVMPRIEEFAHTEPVSEFLDTHNISTRGELLAFYDSHVASVPREDFLTYLHYINERTLSDPDYLQSDLAAMLQHMPYFDTNLQTVVKLDYLWELETFEEWDSLSSDQKKKVVDLVRSNGWNVSRQDIVDYITALQNQGETSTAAFATPQEDTILTLPRGAEGIPSEEDLHPAQIAIPRFRGYSHAIRSVLDMPITLDEERAISGGVIPNEIWWDQKSALPKDPQYHTFSDDVKNVVLYAHQALRYDNNPLGAYWQRLVRGDEILISNKLQDRIDYVVADVKLNVHERDPELLKLIFKGTPNEQLTLVTCMVDRAGRLINDQRVVVIAYPKSQLALQMAA